MSMVKMQVPGLQNPQISGPMKVAEYVRSLNKCLSLRQIVHAP